MCLEKLNTMGNTIYGQGENNGVRIHGICNMTIEVYEVYRSNNYYSPVPVEDTYTPVQIFNYIYFLMYSGLSNLQLQPNLINSANEIIKIPLPT